MPNRLANLVLSDGVMEPLARDFNITGVSSDSRTVQPGFLFAALSGRSANGATFLSDAQKRGAKAAIVAEDAPDFPGLALVRTSNPRRLLALVAQRFFGEQPSTIVAVTGTNGKTSVSVFVRQIWEEIGFRAASLGTIGIVGPDGVLPLGHTTPDPVSLHRSLASLKDSGVEHLAVEASSHGLSQNRLDGLRLAAGAFTNLTRDHLDYHKTVEAYLDAKMELFERLLPRGAPAVINADMLVAKDVLRRCKAADLSLFTVGTQGEDIRILSRLETSSGQLLRLQMRDGTYDVPLPLVGEFQASNALVAAGLVLSTGGEPALVRHALASLKGATGRLELVGQTDSGARVFVDYAHTPDAIETALRALRPSAEGKLHIVFGCGGDRDRGKRPLMAAAAARCADHVIVTDDNPRTEDAATIRREVLVGAGTAMEVPGRAEAIFYAVGQLAAGDVLLIAGKGHEQGQIIGTTTTPFSDHDSARAALSGVKYNAS